MRGRRWRTITSTPAGKFLLTRLLPEIGDITRLGAY
jgi:hypothetical protein